MNELPLAFWSISTTEIVQQLETAREGLSSNKTRQRLAHYDAKRLGLSNTKILTDSDFSQLSDAALLKVDREMIDHPRRWDIKTIRRFMITSGIVSSGFDYLTFGVLLLLLNASQDQFRTNWFGESVITASLIVLVIRSRKPFFKSQSGKYLLLTTLATVVVTLISPFTPMAEFFGFSPLPSSFLLFIGIIVLFYPVTAEIAKTIFYRTVKF